MRIEFGNFKEAKRLVETWHYSGKISRYPVVVACYVEGEEAVAAAVIGLPTARWKVEGAQILELNRLVRAEGVAVPPLSGLVAAAMREVKARGCGDLVVSFADSGQGHHGGVYQACSWVFGGTRPPAMDGCLVDGKFFAGRSCNNLWGTRSPDKLREILKGRRVEGHWSPGKHLYWKAVTKAGKEAAKKLGLKDLAYVKPARNC